MREIFKVLSCVTRISKQSSSPKLSYPNFIDPSPPPPAKKRVPWWTGFLSLSLVPRLLVSHFFYQAMLCSLSPVSLSYSNMTVPLTSTAVTDKDGLLPLMKLGGACLSPSLKFSNLLSPNCWRPSSTLTIREGHWATARAQSTRTTWSLWADPLLQWPRKGKYQERSTVV